MVKAIIRSRLSRHVDAKAIEAAIAAAELRTSGQIRVSLSLPFWGYVRRTADRAFVRMGMMATQHRNGVLFFVVPGRREFVVLGDVGIHEKVGQEFWERVSAAVSERFRTGDLTGGLVHGIKTVGEEMAHHFPFVAERTEDLPDDVDFGATENKQVGND